MISHVQKKTFQTKQLSLSINNRKKSETIIIGPLTIKKDLEVTSGVYVWELLFSHGQIVLYDGLLISFNYNSSDTNCKWLARIKEIIIQQFPNYAIYFLSARLHINSGYRCCCCIDCYGNRLEWGRYDTNTYYSQCERISQISRNHRLRRAYEHI